MKDEIVGSTVSTIGGRERDGLLFFFESEAMTFVGKWSGYLVEGKITIMAMLDAIVDLLAAEVVGDPEEENDGRRD